MQFQRYILILIILCLLSFPTSATDATISYTGSTPVNYSNQTDTTVTINTSITDSANTSATLDWNRSLILWLPVQDETGSTTQDISGNNLDATRDGTTAPATGIFGDNMYFDGYNDYAYIPNNALLNVTDAMTIEGWVYPTGSKYYGFLAKYNQLDGERAWESAVDTVTGWVTIKYGTSTGETPLSTTVSSSRPIVAGKWQHVAIKWNRSGAGKFQIFVNGTETTYSSQTAKTDNMNQNTRPLWIGRYRPGDDNWFEGKMDDIKIWNRALSEAEIKASFDSGVNNLNTTFPNLAVNTTHNFTAYVQSPSGVINTAGTRYVNISTVNSTPTPTPTSTPYAPPANGSAEAWANASYGYRVQQDVPDGARPVQLSLNITNATGTNNATWLFCNGHCYNNFSDLRFYINNSIVAPYWTENNSTGLYSGNTSAWVWVNLTVNGTLFWYYGNTTVSTLSNGTATFPIFDDFRGTLDNTIWNNGTYGAPAINTTTHTAIFTHDDAVYSKSKYASNHFMRTKAKRYADDIVGWWWIGFGTTVSGEDRTKVSSPMYYDSTGSYWACLNGKDSVSYKKNYYTTALDAGYHTAEIRRGGTNDTCIFDDNQTIFPSYYSTTSRYLAIDALHADIEVDWILMGNYSLTGSAWTTWGTETEPAEVATYIPPDPVYASNTTGNFWVNTTWTAGSGNQTNQYNVQVNGVWYNNSTDTYYNATVGAHGWANLSIQAVNFTGTYVLSNNTLDINTQVPNNEPVLSHINNQTLYDANQSIDIYISNLVTDADSDTLTYGTNSTLGTLDNSTGVFSYTAVSGDAGTYYIYFNVTDNYSAVDTENVTMTVKASRNITVNVYNTGWQTILSVQPQYISNIDDVFVPTYVSTWNNTGQSWIKFKHGWTHAESTEVLDGDAFIVKVTSNESVNMWIDSSFDWRFKTGFNLVGVSENMTLSTINSTLNYNNSGCDNVDELTYYYPANMTNVTYTCELGTSQDAAGVNVTEGRGFWAYSLRDFTLENIG